MSGAIALAAMALVACGDDHPARGPDGSLPDGNAGECAPGQDGVVAEDDSTITVRGEIACPVTWTAEKAILLDGLVFVHEGGELTIEPGTTIYGLANSTSGLPSALIKTRAGKIDAQGTADRPIVFTSSNPEGERASSDWGGVVLLGRAHTNKGRNDESDTYLVKNIEGIDPDDARGIYGGDDDTFDCGTLRYVRIEFASAELSPDN
ncbi:MAG: hypothetical protein GXY23_17550, partial [Myxococcales bacterium]|nr:hypothetical protein [Myxococcales bacterium]